MGRTTTARHAKGSTEWKPAFLAALGEHGMVTAACREVGIGRRTAYDARQADEEFALAWADVNEISIEKMEREAMRRAVEGVERDVFYQGEAVGRERHYSDTLLIFLLKAGRPDVYRERVDVKHSGRVEHDLAGMSTTELHELADGLDAKRVT